MLADLYGNFANTVLDPRRLAVAVAAAWLVGAGYSYGDGVVLEKIIVTAQKREEGLQDTPISVTAFTTTLSADVNNSVSQVYAVEGQCYVFAPCGVISQAMIDLLVESEDQAAMISAGGGFAQIYAPDGRLMCDPLPETEEGLLFAEIDLGAIAIAKSFADPVGHYSRPDVTRLLLNRTPRAPVEEFSSEPAEVQPEEDSDEQREIA